MCWDSTLAILNAYACQGALLLHKWGDLLLRAYTGSEGCRSRNCLQGGEKFQAGNQLDGYIVRLNLGI